MFDPAPKFSVVDGRAPDVECCAGRRPGNADPLTVAALPPHTLCHSGATEETGYSPRSRQSVPQYWSGHARKALLLVDTSTAGGDCSSLSHVLTKSKGSIACSQGEGGDNERVTAIDPEITTATSEPRRPYVFALFLIVTGVVGWFGAMALITERVKLLLDPAYTLNCDINPLVSCGGVMDSWQASLLGFPNPLLGVAGFVAPIAVGVALLAGARFDRWFWWAFLAGITGAFIFVHWLFDQAVYQIGALCPWCMLVWLVVIPMFWVLLLWGLKGSILTNNRRVQRIATAVWPFTWVIVLANLVAISVAILVQFPTLLNLLFG
jgi:uncharacterized membrane protein